MALNSPVEPASLDAYARGGYATVAGWLAPDTVRNVLIVAQMQEELAIRGHVAEIGVHHGKLFILLYLLTREEEGGLAVDLFEQQSLNVDQSGRGDREAFEANLRRHACGGRRVQIMPADSTTLSGEDLRAAAGGPMRLISVDGGHLAHIVKHDLATARSAICDGGVIILDDYFNPEFPGVSEGTAAFFLSGASGDVVPFLIAANKVFLTTRSHATAYLDRFARLDLGVPAGALEPFRFYQGPACPIVLTEFLGARVIAYSPDRYRGLALQRRVKRLRRLIRARLGELPGWGAFKHSAFGRTLRKAADRWLPY